METTVIYLIAFVLLMVALGAINAYRVSRNNGEMRKKSKKHDKAPRKW